MFRLRVVPAHGEPFEHPLAGEEVVVGRASDCDLVIADRFLSRKHARLYRQGSDWLAEDLGSRNGTLLNGRRIDQPVALKEGDQLQLSGSVVSLLAEPLSRIDSDSRISDISEHTIFRRASDVIEGQSSLDESAGEIPETTRRFTERLRMLNDVHQALSRPIELQGLLDMILARAFEHLNPEEGVIFLKDAKGGYVQAALHSADEDQSTYLYSETLVREVAEKGLGALVLDVESDERFSAAKSILASGVRSLVAAPLLDSEGSLGMMALSSRVYKRQFAEDDMELLVSLASVAALRIRNLNLAAEAAERRRLAEELKLARQIQVGLLPKELPSIPGFELHAGNIPSSGVSGDYYALIQREQGGACIFMIADVSGKGIGASILTASLEALAAGPIEVGHPVDRICELVSRRLFRRTPTAKYATAFVGELDHASSRLRYANAGHNPALLMRAGGGIEQLGPTGLPLGLMEEADYTAGEVELRVGDTLVLYTDGITEAFDAEEEEYGLERLVAVCARNSGAGPAELTRAIEEDLASFVGGVPYADDRTLVVAHRRS